MLFFGFFSKSQPQQSWFQEDYIIVSEKRAEEELMSVTQRLVKSRFASVFTQNEMTEGKTFGEYTELELQVRIWKRSFLVLGKRRLLLRAKCGLPMLFQRSPNSHYHPCETCSCSLNSFSYVWQMGPTGACSNGHQSCCFHCLAKCCKHSLNCVTC